MLVTGHSHCTEFARSQDWALAGWLGRSLPSKAGSFVFTWFNNNCNALIVLMARWLVPNLFHGWLSLYVINIYIYIFTHTYIYSSDKELFCAAWGISDLSNDAVSKNIGLVWWQRPCKLAHKTQCRGLWAQGEKTWGHWPVEGFKWLIHGLLKKCRN